MIASCGSLESELRQFSREDGVTMADSVDTLGVDMRTRIKNLGAKEKAKRKKEVQGWILAHQERQRFSKDLQESGCQEAVQSGHGASKDLVGPCSGDGSHGKVEIEETDGSCSRQKKTTTSLSLFMEAYGLEAEEELSTVATQRWAEGFWSGKWRHEQKEAWMMQIQEVKTWKQVRGPAGAVMYETHDLGTKWLQWHKFIFEGQGKVDMRLVCTQDVKKMLL